MQIWQIVLLLEYKTEHKEDKFFSTINQTFLNNLFKKINKIGVFLYISFSTEITSMKTHSESFNIKKNNTKMYKKQTKRCSG